jgi:membrane protein DedA with SNARE-associated domain
MLDTLVDAGFSLLLRFGLPMLFVLFILKGAFIGKFFPTSVFLPGYIVAVSASERLIVLSISVASVGYACGQLVVYLLAQRYGVESVRSIPSVSLTEERLQRANQIFHRYSGAGIFVTNLVPYVGTFVMIPAGIASYPFERAAIYALVSTVVNYILIVWFVLGSIRLLSAI